MYILCFTVPFHIISDLSDFIHTSEIFVWPFAILGVNVRVFAIISSGKTGRNKLFFYEEINYFFMIIKFSKQD